MNLASKHAGSNPHLIWIGWEALARSRLDDSCTLACFWTGSIWPKPDTLSQNQIGSGSAWKHWPEVGLIILARRLASVPDPFGPKPDTVSQNPIGPRLVVHDMIRATCGRMQPSLTVGNWWRAGCILPETGPDDSDPPTCFQKRCVCLKPDQAIQIGSRSVLHNVIHVFFGKTELNRMREVVSGIYNPALFWLHAGHNGCMLAITKMLLNRIRHVYWV